MAPDTIRLLRVSDKRNLMRHQLIPVGQIPMTRIRVADTLGFWTLLSAAILSARDEAELSTETAVDTSCGILGIWQPLGYGGCLDSFGFRIRLSISFSVSSPSSLPSARLRR